MSTADEDHFDPFDEEFRREPLSGAAILVVVIADEGVERASSLALALEELIRARGRCARSVVVAPGAERLATEIAWRAPGEEIEPLILITRGGSHWTGEHLDPLLTAIDRSDHVVGSRRLDLGRRLKRWVSGIVWRWVFAVPVADVHSPCRLHRREKLEGIPLQSDSSLLDVEIIAKATFLSHLIDEVLVPPLEAPAPHVSWREVATLFKHPMFATKPVVQPDQDRSRPLVAADLGLANDAVELLAGTVIVQGRTMTIRVETLRIAQGREGRQSLAAMFQSLRARARQRTMELVVVEAVSVGNTRLARILVKRYGAEYTPQRTLVMKFPLG
jgi:hypothetical protein